jgi:Na+(H+)/acetate symporter ActP
MPHKTDAVALTVFCLLFGLVTIMGFVAARWRRGDLSKLDEWGLGGRRFCTVVTWFLLGGDLYTAYTFIAVPALVFGVGAQGFFAQPYTILVYPLAFIVLPRMWVVAHRRGYVTPADFVRARFGSRPMATAVAITGLLATMPYIALQLVGIKVVLGAMGISGDGPLIIAFVILAAYTYQSGLRAPALIAIVKDLLDLHHGHRRGHLHPVQARRIRRDLRRRRQGAAGEAAQARRADPRHQRRPMGLRDARVRLGHGDRRGSVDGDPARGRRRRQRR